jgi:hypothetical protein
VGAYRRAGFKHTDAGRQLGRAGLQVGHRCLCRAQSPCRRLANSCLSTGWQRRCCTHPRSAGVGPCDCSARCAVMRASRRRVTLLPVSAKVAAAARSSRTACRPSLCQRGVDHGEELSHRGMVALGSGQRGTGGGHIGGAGGPQRLEQGIAAACVPGSDSRISRQGDSTGGVRVASGAFDASQVVLQPVQRPTDQTRVVVSERRTAPPPRGPARCLPCALPAHVPPDRRL